LFASEIYLLTAVPSSGTISSSGRLIASNLGDSELVPPSSDFRPSPLPGLTSAFLDSDFADSPPAAATANALLSSQWNCSPVHIESTSFTASPAPTGNGLLSPTSTPIFKGSATFEASPDHGKSREFPPSPVHSARLVFSSSFGVKGKTADEGSPGTWLVAGIGLAVLALIALATLVILFLGRRGSTEVQLESPSSTEIDCNSWVGVIHEEDEQFVDYENPLDFSDDPESYSDGRFSNIAGE
jgi:hypothetical protein